MTTHRYDPKDVEISFTDPKTGARHTYRGDDVKSFTVERSMKPHGLSSHWVETDTFHQMDDGVWLRPRTREEMLEGQRTALALVLTHRPNPNPTSAIFLYPVVHGERVFRVHPGIGLHHLEGIPPEGSVVWRGGDLWRVRR